MSESMIDTIINKVDHDQNGKIDYSEFLTHSLTKKQLSEENIEMFYKIMEGNKDI